MPLKKHLHRKTPPKLKESRRAQPASRTAAPDRTMSKDVRRSLVVIIVFIFSLLLLLSYFGMAGRAGNWLDAALAELFGRSRPLVPFALASAALLVEWRAELGRSASKIFGLLLLFVAVNGLLHLTVPPGEMLARANAGEGGGLFGFIIAYPLLSWFSFWAALVILIGISCVACIFLFHITLRSIVALPMRIGNSFVRVWQDMKYGARTEILSSDEDVVSAPPSFASRDVAHSAHEEQEENIPPIFEKSESLGSPMGANAYASYSKDLPPFSLLHQMRSDPTSGDIKANLYTIKKTFENFGIQVEMGEVRVGPTVTQYALKPADGVKLSRITGLHNDLALALAAHPIRIEAPIPGKSLVGIEVPNQKVALVTLRELLETSEFKNGKADLWVALGKDVAGKPYFADLSKLPHLLVAGATGSGKTVCVNALILSLLFQHTPRTLRFIMVDPKRVELPLYNGIPHLLTPVITDTQKTVNALRWTIGEMERRFEVLSKAGRRDIGSYNRVMEEKMPYIVFIVDELADLMASAGPEIEGGVIRLAQMARAVGIHLLLATQRPSVDVITGLIKANVPARIAFSVASQMDSRTILDMSGAEKLLGRGDMLWSSPESSYPKRLQGAFVSEEDIKALVDYYKEDGAPSYVDEITNKKQGTLVFGSSSSGDEGGDPLLNDAKDVVVRAGKASASLLQRRLKVGYARAARLLDILEEKGVIGPSDGAKPRDVLIAKSNFDTIPTSSIPEDAAAPDDASEDGVGDPALAGEDGQSLEVTYTGAESDEEL